MRYARIICPNSRFIILSAPYVVRSVHFCLRDISVSSFLQPTILFNSDKNIPAAASALP